MGIKRFIKGCPSWIFTTIVVLAILYLTLVPKPLPDIDIPLFPGADKVVHGIMMGGLMLCVGLDLARQNRDWSATPPKICLITATLAVIAFGGAIELIQGAMKMGRGEDIYDFLADAIGALTGLIILNMGWKLLVVWLRDE